ncbi:MAG: trypsin-like peptidase domain-containing protein [Turicibacter sp.]|nr:trypsin-like peptidase domain-containing protein [Turicibacter sp.]
MNKVLYTSMVVLVTVWSIFFITRTPEVPTNSQEVAETIFVSQEQAQISSIQAVSPAVVGIANVQSERIAGEGSGVVFLVEDGNTYLVTNEHVIDGADYLEVVFNNGTRINAEVVGSDIFTDLAVLRLPGYEASRIAAFGNTEDLKIGQTVIAIGNPLGLTFAGSATMGIVSGQDRSVPVMINPDGNERQWEMTVLQTDTAINPGNSGGALINLNSEVVGVNSMKVSAQDVYGMSFSIPTYVILPVIEDIKEHGRVIRPTLGVSIIAIENLPPSIREEHGIPENISNGVLVSQILPDTMAEAMGILPGDVITHLGEASVQTVMNFTQQLFTYQEGDHLTLTVIRNGEELELETEVIILG